MTTGMWVLALITALLYVVIVAEISREIRSDCDSRSEPGSKS